MRVVLYGKPGCHLCDLAESRLRAMSGRRPFALAKVDILSDPALEERFGMVIPVVEIDGRIVSEGRFDEKAVARAVAGGTAAPGATPV